PIVAIANTPGSNNSLIFTGAVTLNGLSSMLTSNLGNNVSPGLPSGQPGAAAVFFLGNLGASSTLLIKQGAGATILAGNSGVAFTSGMLINAGVVNAQQQNA